MPPTRPTYTFDVEGHTVVTPEKEPGTCTFDVPGKVIAGNHGILVLPDKKKTPEWLSQALNEGDGVYRP